MAVLKHLTAPAARFGRAPYYAGALAALLALSACGGGGGEGGTGGGAASPASTPSVQADPELADMVPQEIRDQGFVKIGTDSTYPPAEYLSPDGETVVGFDVQLFNAVAAKLDLQTRWQSSAFGTIVEGVDTGKYDVGVSSFTINEERMQQVNMVSYYTVGTQWFTAEGNPENVAPDDACGKNVAVQANTIQVPDIEARSQECVDNGEQQINVSKYKGQNQATESIISGRNDAGLADMPVAVYAVEQTEGQLQTIGEQYEAAPYGAITAKDATELAEAIRAGYQSIMDDGTYTEILAEWELDGQGTLDQAEVNPSVEG
ncbi:ABC transporter substrate-binding protein [Streptomonospora litoralis]|uniref:ABC transporter substrate-binding protein n=1 Tax=Streptomonospora litoralis TaxID=2498135 RepID=UPI003743E475